MKPKFILLALGSSSFFPGVLAAQDAETDGPGADNEVNSYLPSDSRPIVGEQEDGFDFSGANQSGRPLVVSGAQDESKGELSEAGNYRGITYAQETKGENQPQRAVPEFHVVKKGDTLWTLSETYFQDSLEWPRVWSMNPQVENPHWIYPGDQLRVGGAAAQGDSLATDGSAAGSENGLIAGGMVVRRRLVPEGTVFLRSVGYLGESERDDWGLVVGVREERMFVTEGDTVYLKMNEEIDLRLGQRLNLFDNIRPPKKVRGARRPPGQLVKVYGTVRVDDWNRETRVARALVIESLDSIERGVHVGPVARRFDRVAPRPAQTEVLARVLDTIYPSVYIAQGQVVFIDKGKDDGLLPGNRLRVFRRGDIWRRRLKLTSEYADDRVILDSPKPSEMRNIPSQDDEEFPDEIIGEVLVLRVEESSAVAVVTRSDGELKHGDRMIATVGY